MIIELSEDYEGNVVLPLPEDVVTELGWRIGDAVKWVDNEDGTFSLYKIEADE